MYERFVYLLASDVEDEASQIELLRELSKGTAVQQALGTTSYALLQQLLKEPDLEELRLTFYDHITVVTGKELVIEEPVGGPPTLNKYT